MENAMKRLHLHSPGRWEDTCDGVARERDFRVRRGMSMNESVRTAWGVAVFCAIALLAACGRSASPPGQAAATSPAINAAAAPGDDGDSALPKVPFGNHPCQSLSQDEQKQLGFAKVVPGKPGREPDDLAYDNTCEFAYQTIVYDTTKNCAYQKDNLRSQQRSAPADIPGSFYDVLGNLWFSEKGYCVALPNNLADATREKMARVIAAKL